MVWLLTIAASFAAVGIEYLYRASHPIWVAIPLIVVLNVCFYFVFQDKSTSLVALVAGYSLCTAITRTIVYHFALGEEIAKGNLLAIILLGVATTAGRLWK